MELAGLNQEMPDGKSGNILIYTTPTGKVRVELLYGEETFWLSQKRMAELFGVEVKTINEHILNILATGELASDPTIRKFRIVQIEGKRDVAREVLMYNLDMMIAVGYRVNSFEATQFRIWATATLREFIIKGFVLDDERLKQGTTIGKDYFDELLERIRDIRASERRFYQKITDLYALSLDYSAAAPITRRFFATVQNKLEWAITGQTAAELIATRADAKKPNMGLQTWKNSPTGKIMKSDVSVAKNYLKEQELNSLNGLVEQYLLFAESQAKRGLVMRMENWVEKLDSFLAFNQYEILKDTGKVVAEVAKTLAEKHFEAFRVEQDKQYESDFDKSIQLLETAAKSKPKK